MPRALHFVPLALLATAACDRAALPVEPTDASSGTPSFAAASVLHSSQTFPFEISGVNPCTGEETPATSGEILVQSTEVATPDGGYHLELVTTGSATAVGSVSGARYVAHLSDAFTVNVRPDQISGEFTEPVSFRVVAPGPLGNFERHDLFHLTVNPDGTITASITHLSEECLG